MNLLSIKKALDENPLLRTEMERFATFREEVYSQFKVICCAYCGGITPEDGTAQPRCSKCHRLQPFSC